jgi:hypothetical protein
MSFAELQPARHAGTGEVAGWATIALPIAVEIALRSGAAQR